MSTTGPAARPNLRVILLTALALAAFAGNSVLCRMALKGGSIDAAGFSAVRLVSGALALGVLLRIARGEFRPSRGAGGWLSAAMLFLYAIGFSFAYTSLDTGTGALILFGMVQATMIAGSFLEGRRPTRAEWAGWMAAAVGFVYLLSPGLTAPPPIGAGLMALAGVGWGVYSLRGRRETDFLASTAYNFARSTAMVLPVALLARESLDLTAVGVLLATISGAVTSGAGYAVWYAALRGLTAMQAAMVQLAVPALAAAAGALLLSEPPSARLLASGALILGGVALALSGGPRRRRK